MKIYLLFFDFLHRFENKLIRAKSIFMYRYGTRKRIMQYGNTLPKLTAQERKEIYDFWYLKHGFRPDYNMFRWYYGMYGKKDCRYISEDIYDNYVWCVLNDVSRCKGYNDKNMSDLLYMGEKFPKTIIRRINNEFLNDKYELISKETAISLISKYDSVAVKPSIDGWEGKGVVKFNVHETDIAADEKNTEYAAIYIGKELEKHGREFIVQEIVRQHSSLAMLNESSVNVVRITSLLINGKVHILNSVIRIGSEGEFTDHFNIVIGIDGDGCMNKTGICRDTEVIDSLPNGIKFGGMKIIGFEKMREIAVRLHSHTPQARIIGWDMTVDEEGNVVVIEANLRFPGAMKVQDGTGPFFGDLTDEVLDFCKQKQSISAYCNRW